MRLILSDRPLTAALPVGEDLHVVDLSSRRIANCVGCFGCWTRTPGRCVLRDDAPEIYPLIASSQAVLYISRVQYGGFDTVMKTMLERAIPIQQAFMRLVDGEIHHVQRAVVPKQATIVGYGAQDQEEEALFRRLVDRNAKNMNFQSWKVVCCPEQGGQVEREVEAWLTS